jgi:DNA segregation ATPase FtsK/SpoIIIE-like protein
MSDVDVRAPRGDRNSKLQIEEQKIAQRADFRDSQWQKIEYPNKSLWLRPFQNASLFEIVGGTILLIFGVILIFRIFFVSVYDRTPADVLGLILFYSFLTLLVFAAGFMLVARVIKYYRESKIFILPNGFPISIKTIMQDYGGIDQVLNQPGYFSVEQARATNPIVAPGEITTTNSPSYTYAPSNMPKGESDGVGEQILQRMIQGVEEKEAQDLEPLPDMVNFFDHIDERVSGYIIAGQMRSGELLQIPIMQMFNHLVGGQVGSGKSIYLRSLVYQLLTEADEADIPLKIGLADIENNTFPEFRGCRHVQWYAGNYIEIEQMTSELLREVESRKIAYESLTSTPKDIERYNVLAGREGAPELPIIVVFYDEFSALMHRSQAQQKRILSDLLQLALRARKYGIFLVIAGQTFKADLIDSAVLGQFNFNVAFRVRNSAVSMSVLGQPGAEKLTHPGEAIVKMKDGKIEHLQTLFLDDDELLEHLVEYQDAENKNNVPQLVRVIINFAHERLEDQLKIRELELYLREQGIARGELLQNIQWMDDHKFTIRGPRNGRMLNWSKINGE